MTDNVLTFRTPTLTATDTDPVAESLVSEVNESLEGRVRATKEAATAVDDHAQLLRRLYADLSMSKAAHPPGFLADLDKLADWFSFTARRYRRLANNTPDGGAAS